MAYAVSEFATCTNCSLRTTRTRVLFGKGTMPADILFVSDTVSDAEEALGRPLVGFSGRLFTRAVEDAMRIAEKEPSIYVTTIVGCKCLDEEGIVRAPTDEEAWACWPRFDRIYRDASPRRVVALGDRARALCAASFPDVRHLFHPAYVERGGGIGSPLYLRLIRDMAEIFKEI